MNLALTSIALATLQAGPAVPTTPETPLILSVRVQIGTEIRLRLLDQLSTARTPRGTTFRLEVAEDVRVNNMVAIKSGTLAVGEVTRSEPKGAFGASGKLEARVLYLMIDGRPVRLSGHLNAQGKSGTTGTVLTAIAAGSLAFVVTGKTAVLLPGQILSAWLERDLLLVGDSSADDQLAN